jgi:hypothetical protein
MGMYHRFARILFFFVILGLAHGAYVQLTSSRYDKKVVEELSGQSNLFYIEHYLYSSNHSPLLLTGTSMTGCIDTTPFRVPADMLPILGGDVTVLDLLSEQPTLPSLILLETNNIYTFSTDHKFAKTANSFLKRHLKQCQTSFRPTYMFLTELTNFIDMVQGRDQDEIVTEAPAVVTSYQNDLKEQEIQRLIGIFQRIPPSEELNNAVAHIKQRVDQFSKRGTRVVMLELPMDPRLAATPHYAHINSAMRAAFPADQYQWITLQPALFEYIDGLHVARQSARKLGQSIDQAIASLGLYRQLGLVSAKGDARTGIGSKESGQK